jgi:hypothetical protein
LRPLRFFAPLWLGVSLLLLLSSCKGSSNKPAPQPSGSPAASTRPAGPPKPVGIYEITEIEHDGRVDIRGPANEAVTLTLFPNGSYSRLVKGGGKNDHIDQGDFRIDGDDLVLTANIVDKKPLTSGAPEWRRPIKVSDDGVELRIGDGKNHWAVFRRTKELGTG